MTNVFRQELLERLVIEFGLAPRKILEQNFQRLVDGTLANDEDRHIFLISPQNFASGIQGLHTNVLIRVLKDVMRETSTLRQNVHPMQSDCYDTGQGQDEFMDMPLMESSSDSDWTDESDSWIDEPEIEPDNQGHAKALVVNPFNTQK